MRAKVDSSGKSSRSLKAYLVSMWLPQHDVRKLEGEDRSQRPFRRQRVHQALAEDDGVAYRNRFQWSGQHHAAVHWRGELDVVADDNVVRNLLEHLIEVTGSGEQTSPGFRRSSTFSSACEIHSRLCLQRTDVL